MKINVQRFSFIKEFSFREAFAVGKHDNSEGENDGFSVAVCILFVLLMAAVVCNFCAVLLNRMALKSSFDLAESVSARMPSVPVAVKEQDVFSQANLFGSVIRSSNNTESRNADSFVLRGTLPHIGAWISSGGDAKLLLLHQQVAGWTLEDVSYGKILLSKDGDSCALYMSYSNGSGGTAAAPSLGRTGGKTEKLDFSSVRKAEKGKDGFMPRELVDKLLMNPYDEVGKMRMVPANGGGMQLERIDPSSVLGIAGVQQGDVIKAINGVNISNLGDLTNAINSMLAGSRFDVSVERGKEKLDLKYSVN